jgi:hypothetical protein
MPAQAEIMPPTTGINPNKLEELCDCSKEAI